MITTNTNVSDYSLKELNILFQEIQHEIETREKEERMAAAASHAELIGKCFKKKTEKMWKYYKIISNHSSNEYWVSALTFDEYPTYRFDCYDNYSFFGEYSFQSIEVVDLPFYCYDIQSTAQTAIVGDSLIEISLEEYNSAMDLYIKRLQKLKWPIDTWRRDNE